MSLVTIYIGKESYQTEPGLRRGEDLIKLVGITPPQQLVDSRSGALDIPIAESDYITVEEGDKFAVGDGDLPLPDNPCLRVPIPFFLNSELFDDEKALTHPKITGAEIKRLATGYQEGDSLFAEIAGIADEPIQDDMRILVQHKNVFITVPCGNVGDQSASSAIQPLEKQINLLKQHYPNVELLSSGHNQTLVVHDVPLNGWPISRTDLLIQIPSSYPHAALDMFWVKPHIKMPSGSDPDRGNVFENLLGDNWQRFSWHYPPNRGWNPAVNDLLSHTRFCLSRLNKVQ